MKDKSNLSIAIISSILLLFVVVYYATDEFNSINILKQKSQKKNNSNSSIKLAKSIDVNELINNKKGQMLFLSFWAGMNNTELQLIKDFENKRGNLENGYFLLMLSLENIPMEISSNDNSVSLSYFDEQWVNYLGEPYYVLNHIPNGKSYENIEAALIEAFDNNYKRINDKSEKSSKEENNNYNKIFQKFQNEKTHNKVIQWKSTNETKQKIITLSSNFHFLDKNFDINISRSGATPKYYFDRENKKVKIGSCNISITYEFMDDYIQRNNEQRKWEQEYIQKRKAEELEKEKRIQRNNRNL